MKAGDLVVRNSEFYDALWAKTYLNPPQRFNTWPMISALLPSAPMRLEIGPGLRPRLPVAGTHFLDLSGPAVTRLNHGGGMAQAGQITALPYATENFDLVAAFDVIEHVEDDQRVFAELIRVMKPQGVLLFSVPLHPAHWNEFDEAVGHARRYQPAELRALLEAHDLIVEKSAVFGMQPSNSPLIFASYRVFRGESLLRLRIIRPTTPPAHQQDFVDPRQFGQSLDPAQSLLE